MWFLDLPPSFKIRQADLAKAKDKFIVQPDKMRAMLNFWVAHNPKIMKILQVDDEDMELAFAQLPDGDVAPEMFVCVVVWCTAIIAIFAAMTLKLYQLTDLAM